MKTIAFTGHRPSKLGGYDWSTPKNKAIANKLKEILINIMANSQETEFRFITGGALGLDQIACEVTIMLREQFKNTYDITIEVAVPFENQPNNWVDQLDIDTYYSQLEDADDITYVDILKEYQLENIQEGIYHAAKLQKRNEYMVDQCNMLIACWDGTTGGTCNCINYAKKQLEPPYILILSPQEIWDETGI